MLKIVSKLEFALFVMNHFIQIFTHTVARIRVTQNKSLCDEVRFNYLDLELVRVILPGNWNCVLTSGVICIWGDRCAGDIQGVLGVLYNAGDDGVDELHEEVLELESGAWNAGTELAFLIS